MQWESARRRDALKVSWREVLPIRMPYREMRAICGWLLWFSADIWPINVSFLCVYVRMTIHKQPENKCFVFISNFIWFMTRHQFLCTNRVWVNNDVTKGFYVHRLLSKRNRPVVENENTEWAITNCTKYSLCDVKMKLYRERNEEVKWFIELVA